MVQNSGLMQGKRGVILGVANNRSIAWGIARACHAQGAEIALTGEGIKVTRPGKFTKMVDTVEHVTFSGKRAREQGQDVLYVTERCVMRLGDGGLVATEIMPGIEPARDIVAASEGRVRIADNATVMPLNLLTREPMGWAP